MSSCKGVARLGLRLSLDDIHRNALRLKEERVEGLRALIESWDSVEVDDPEHIEYMRDLRKRHRAARVQLEAMRP